MTTLRISRLLLDLYACPTEQSRWPAVLDQLCRTLKVRSAVIQVLIPATGRVRSRWMVRDSRSEAARALHDRYFADAVNPRMLVERPPPSVDQGIFRDCDYFQPDDPLFADLKQRLAATGLGNYLSAQVPLSGDEALALILHRAANDTEEFSKREERVALDLMPHLRQAVQLSGTMLDAHQQVRQLRETLDSFRFALLMCKADGSLCWSNEAAGHILARRDVLWLNGGRQLTASSGTETKQLRQTIARAAQDPNGACDPRLLVLGGTTPRALQVRVQGIGHASTGRDMDSNGRALLVLGEPHEDVTLPPELLRQLFTLSPAESRLAAALCAGTTLGEYAQQAGIAIGTARYQLKQVMAKMQVSKQSQLVQRVCTSALFHLRD